MCLGFKVISEIYSEMSQEFSMRWRIRLNEAPFLQQHWTLFAGRLRHTHTQCCKVENHDMYDSSVNTFRKVILSDTD